MSPPGDSSNAANEMAEPIFTSELTTIYERTTITEVMHMQNVLIPGSSSHHTKGVQQTKPLPSESAPPLPTLNISGLSPIENAKPTDLEINDSLGVGGMGSVYLASQTSMVREVAIKRSHQPSGQGPSFDSVRAEGLLFGRLDHPNIPPVHMVGVDDSGHAILVMKRIEGTDLHTMLKTPEHPRWSDVEGDTLTWMLDIFIQVSHAVDHAHSRNVLHRDIKSENIMVCDFGQVFLIDWGIAIDMTDKESATTNGKFIGTPCFAAPEMLSNGARLNERVDVYLLGAMLLEMVSGGVLFKGRSLKEIIKKVRNNQREEIPSSVPHALAKIIAQATASDPSARFPTVKALQSAVRQYKTDRYMYANIAQAEKQMATLDGWLRERRTDPQTAYQFMTVAHEALALLKTALKASVATHHVRKLLAQNVALQTRYAILNQQFGVANTLVAELKNEMGEASPWAIKLSEEIATATHAIKNRRSEIQVQANVKMIEKLKQMEDDLIRSGQTRETIRATLNSAFSEE